MAGDTDYGTMENL